MNREDRLALLRGGVRGQVWADLGAGEGAFTDVLAELLGEGGTVYAIERDRRALRELGRLATSARVVPVEGDFARDLTLPLLDGLLMANSLHYVRDPAPVLARLAGHLRAGGVFLIVEYEDRRPSPWVPYPLPLARLARLCEQLSWPQPRRLAERPSRYGGRVYSATLSSGVGDDGRLPQA